jgi:hypothetical protein
VVAQRRAQSKLVWNKKKKKFVRGDGTGSDNVKMVRAESGVKLPASYRSGRFDEWRAKARVSLPRVGDATSQEGGMGASHWDKYVAKSSLRSKFARLGRSWRNERQRIPDQAARRGSDSVDFLGMHCKDISLSNCANV